MSEQFMLRVGGADIVVNTKDRETLFEDVAERFHRGRGFAIATLNLDHLVKIRRSAAFRAAYQRQDLVVADGNPVVWLSRLARHPVSLVTGSDLVRPLAALAAREGVAVALLGATEETLDRAAQALLRDTPDLRIVARLAPSQGFDPDGAEAGRLIEQLGQSGAGLTFLALGAPRQEMFAARCRDALPEMGFASIGAGLDFLAESQHRAPVWMRNLALEWLWRVMSNPQRMAMRYALCALTLPGLALSVGFGAMAETPVTEPPLRPLPGHRAS